jgi:ubiquinone/menaquinone biosynthesis C-methylase UbiE
MRRRTDRDVAAFEARAPRYEVGRLGALHRDIADRTADLALAVRPTPSRVLDVGCGSGYLLRMLAARAPEAKMLVGVDPAARMIRVAQVTTNDERLRFSVGRAEELPFSDASFDLVVTTTSFDHWANQRAGLAECARVLAPGGGFVLADLFSWLLLPTLLVGHRGKARTRTRANRMLVAAGLHDLRWHRLYKLILQAVTATN